jgi:hypothetical protein
MSAAIVTQKTTLPQIETMTYRNEIYQVIDQHALVVFTYVYVLSSDTNNMLITF